MSMLTPPVDPKADPRPFYAALVEAIRQLQTPAQPTLVAAFTAAGLPPAASWLNGVVRVSDLDILAVSNGAAWIRQDTGAAI